MLPLLLLQAPTLQDLEHRLTALQVEVSQLQSGRAAEAETLARRDAEIASLLAEIDELSQRATPSSGSNDRRLSLGSYGEIHYNDLQGGANQIDIHRFVLYLGYGFNDWIQLHSETELEHGFVEDGNGEIAIEQLYLDFLTGTRCNLRAGRMLAPLGIVNLRHEPPTFNGVERPAVETVVLPSTWTLDGAGLFGELTDELDYQLALTGSLDGSGFSALEGIRGGRQEERPGLSEPALSGRLDWRPAWNAVPDLRWGLSGFAGGLDNGNQGVDPGLDADLAILSTDAQCSFGRWDFRGVYAYEWIDGARELSALTGESIASDIVGWYLEAGWHCLPEKWKTGRLAASDAIVFARYEDFDTQHTLPSGVPRDPAGDRTEFTFGLGFLPVPGVAIKLDYQVRDDASSGNPADQLNFGLGFSL
jgi:hypothetical protein